jgi:TolB protein
MRRPALTALWMLVLAAPALAQEQPQGIRLAAPYNVTRPLVAVRPFTGTAANAVALDSLTRIVQRDLTFNKRFRMLPTIPEQLRSGELDFAQWNGLNVVYVVAGDVTPTERGFELSIAVHDVVYKRMLQQQKYALPSTENQDFRMAVHAIADEVVRWISQTPGVAASRIAMTRKNGNGNDDLLVIDSDGFNMRRIAGYGGQLYSPSWSPDARRVLYAVNGQRGWELIEQDITSGSKRTIRVPGGDMIVSPMYTPDGQKALMALWHDNRQDIVEFDLERSSTRKLSGQRVDIEVNPAPSPDGRRVAFSSNRLGSPHIFIMSSTGGDATVLTPLVGGQRGYYTSPSWSPTSSRIAFHGHWNSRGVYQIMIADADRPGAITQLTPRGNNEDPSWAPDGRHLVYTSDGTDAAAGLVVIDTESQEKRPLAPGANLRMAEWSPRLVKAADLVVRASPSSEED